MRQSVTTILFAVLMSMVGINAFAHDFQVKNADGATIYYRWDFFKTEVSVSYRGDYREDFDEYWEYIDYLHTDINYSGDIVIPESVELNGRTYSVTAIDNYAFAGCSGLTSVSIPNSVESIGERAFYNCSGLTSIKVESGNEKYDSRNNCNAIIETSSNILIAGCKNTIIPNSVTSIGSGAFSSCSGLTSVTIPNSVTSIGDDAFTGCTGLTSVTIPNSVTYIGDYAFAWCSGLTSVTIPNSVTTIGDRAFSGCGLTSISIPNSVTTIGDGAFGCSGLTSIQVESGNMNYDSRNNCNAIIDNNNQLILGCKNTIIPNSVTSIGDDAFYNCRGLVYITLPSNVTSIGDWAFNGCNSLTDIYCKAVNVPSASSYAFSNQGNITLHVPNESLNAYQTTEPWNKFKNYESLSSDDLYASEKCSKPTISIVDGRFVFNCETSNVSYNWSISTPSGTNGRYGSFVSLPITLNVFATKSGYLPSDVATYDLSGLEGDVNNDGEVNVADHVKLSDIIMEQKK